MIEVEKKERFLRLPDVKTRTGLSRSSIYLFMSKGKFPQNISLGTNSVGWIESEIDEWINNLINQRQKAMKE